MANLLEAARRTRGWSQADLSSRSGVSQSLISKIERGSVASPSYRVVVRLARALRVPEGRLFPEPEQGAR